MGVAHYLEALEWQRDMIRIHAVLGSKNPHVQTYLVGGMALPIDPNSQAALNAERLALLQQLFTEALQFVEQVYIPDLLAIADFYKDWAAYGSGHRNYLSYGDFPLGMGDASTEPDLLFFPRGIIRDGDLSTVHPVDQNQVAEYVTHSWYSYADGDTDALHPWQGETTANYTGPQPPYEFLNTGEDDKYSWLKSPRYDNQPMEVGPLSRVLVAYASPDAPSHESIKAKVDTALEYLDVEASALFSTLGRVAARGIETWVVAEQALVWLDALITNIGAGDLRIHNGMLWDPRTWPFEAQGFGLSDAPRGALGHWVRIRNGKIENYQCVVPSTWNAGPRDSSGVPGPYEAALIGTPIADPEQPLEILRTVHSFDPCMACAAHIVDPSGKELISIKVQ
jgi:Ni,Fe-hydrogenase I large subunit